MCQGRGEVALAAQFGAGSVERVVFSLKQRVFPSASQEWAMFWGWTDVAVWRRD